MANGEDAKADGAEKTLNGSDAKNGANASGSSLLSVLADVALSKEKKVKTTAKNGYGDAVNGSDGESDVRDSDDDEGGEHFSTLRELLIRPAPKSSGNSAKSNADAQPVAKRQRMETLEDVISCVIERGVDRDPSPEGAANNPQAPSAPVAASSASSGSCGANDGAKWNGEREETPAPKVELVHFKRRDDAFKTVLTRGMLPPRVMVLTESEKQHPGIPHEWLAHGKVLWLRDPTNANNYKIFQVSCSLFARSHRTRRSTG